MPSENITPSTTRFHLIDKVRHPRSTDVSSSAGSTPGVESRDLGCKALLFLTGVTVGYLLVEMAFSAWLIDILAGGASSKSIRNAEHIGRLLSGFALALLFWPKALGQRHRIDQIAMLVIVTGAIMFSFYHAQRMFVDHLVRNSGHESRAAAVIGTLLHTGLVTGQIHGDMLGGLWTPQIMASPAGKAFAGISAYMAAGSQQALSQTMSLAPHLIRTGIDQSLGGASAEHERFLTSQQVIRDQFESYQEAAQRYRQAAGRADQESANAWEEYLDHLDAQHPYWGRKMIKYPRRDGHLVIEKAVKPTREAVRSMGIMVPNNWNTGDKRTFLAAAKKAYLDKIKSQLGEPLQGMPMNLDLHGFAASKQIQAQWKASLGYPDSISSLPIRGITPSQFASQIYTQTLDQRTQSTLDEFRTDAVNYADGQALSQKGREAYEAMIVPVMALVFSLLGCMTHLFKSGFLLIHLSTGLHIRSAKIKGIAIITLCFVALFLAATRVQTPLTSHPTYRQWASISTQIDANGSMSTPSAIVGLGLDSVIKAQSIAYPAFSYVKKQFLPLIQLASTRQISTH